MARREERVWQASLARSKLPALLEGALNGVPQVIRKRSGEEVVVLSRSDYDALRPTMQDYLLRGGCGPEEGDPFDEALREGRRLGVSLLGAPSVPRD